MVPSSIFKFLSSSCSFSPLRIPLPHKPCSAATSRFSITPASPICKGAPYIYRCKPAIHRPRKMSGESSLRVNDDPRGYQLEIARRATEGNVIAVADTGSGKTLISVLLLKRVVARARATAAVTGKQVTTHIPRPTPRFAFIFCQGSKISLAWEFQGIHLTCDFVFLLMLPIATGIVLCGQQGATGLSTTCLHCQQQRYQGRAYLWGHGCGQF